MIGFDMMSEIFMGKQQKVEIIVRAVLRSFSGIFF